MAMMRKMRPRRRVARKRRVPRRRIGGTGSRAIEKVYTYTMKPNQAYLSCAYTTPGLLIVSPLSAPLTFPLLSGTTASKTNFTGYYDFGAGISFQLADLANYTAYTGIYDNYKINSITLELEYMQSYAVNTSTGVNPTVYAVQDHDDSNTPGVISNVTSHAGCKNFRFGNKGQSTFKITIKPRLAANVYGSNLTSIGYQQAQGWQDCNFPNNQYYGLKLWFTDVYLPGQENVNTAFRWKWTYNVSFKGGLNQF